MKIFGIILSLISFASAIVVSFIGDYDRATFLMTIAIFVMIQVLNEE